MVDAEGRERVDQPGELPLAGQLLVQSRGHQPVGGVVVGAGLAVAGVDHGADGGRDGLLHGEGVAEGLLAGGPLVLVEDGRDGRVADEVGLGVAAHAQVVDEGLAVRALLVGVLQEELGEAGQVDVVL